jgi:hypothetical protein
MGHVRVSAASRSVTTGVRSRAGKPCVEIDTGRLARHSGARGVGDPRVRGCGTPFVGQGVKDVTVTITRQDSDAATRHGEVSTRHGEVSTRHGEVSPRGGEVTLTSVSAPHSTPATTRTAKRRSQRPNDDGRRAAAVGIVLASGLLAVCAAVTRGEEEGAVLPGGPPNVSTVPGPMPPTSEPTREPTASVTAPAPRPTSPAPRPTSPAPRPTASQPAVAPTTPAPRPTASHPAVAPTTPAPRPTASATTPTPRPTAP